MNIAIKKTHAHENTLIWAVIASLLLHVLLAWVLPNFHFDTVKPNKVLEIELQKPVPPAPVAAPTPPMPEPVKPEPIKPEPIKEVSKPTITPKPIIKPIESPSPIKQEAAPPPAVDKVIAVESSAESKSTITAPVETPKTSEPAPAEVDNALSEYGSKLGRAIAKHKQYPRIAQMRGWQGDVLLDLKIDGNGNVLSAKVRESSGHEALDNQALEMVRKASPFPAPPEALRSRTFNITVPVSFKLENA